MKVGSRRRECRDKFLVLPEKSTQCTKSCDLKLLKVNKRDFEWKDVLEPSTISLLSITLPGPSCTLPILLIHSFFFNMQYNNTFSYFQDEGRASPKLELALKSKQTNFESYEHVVVNGKESDQAFMKIHC